VLEPGMGVATVDIHGADRQADANHKTLSEVERARGFNPTDEPSEGQNLRVIVRCRYDIVAYAGCESVSFLLIEDNNGPIIEGTNDPKFASYGTTIFPPRLFRYRRRWSNQIRHEEVGAILGGSVVHHLHRVLDSVAIG
jgi:hypothetical protein